MFFIEVLVIHGTVISRRAPSGSLWIKDYRIIYFFLYVEDNATTFFDKGLCFLFVFLGNYDCEKIHLNFVKP